MCVSEEQLPLVMQAEIKEIHGHDSDRLLWESDEQEVLSSWVSPWLQSIGLSHHLKETVEWCEVNGAAELSEVEEYWSDLAAHLGMTEREYARLAAACSRQSDSGSNARCGEDMDNEHGCATPEPILEEFGTPEAPYAMREQLGHGASATVYRCTRGSSQFAAKVIGLERLQRLPQSQDILRQMQREVAFLWTLRHPKIVQLHDVVEEPSRLILVMELLCGGTLFDHILSEQRLAAEEARHIFLQVVEGVRFMHSQQIIHRDLKPENILIDAEASSPGLPEIKISDFGHSKAIRDGHNQAASVVGTRQYWAPEVEEMGRVYDESVDLWSLGVVLYVMIMGHYPFPTGERKSDFQFRGSRQIDELVRGLICIRPEDRMTLDQCLQCSWLTATKSSCAAARIVCKEFRFRLPHAPEDVASLQADLIAYSVKHRASARLEVLTVIATFFEDEDKEATASEDEQKEALIDIILLHAPMAIPQQMEVMEGGDWRLGPFNEEASSARKEELESLEAVYGSELVVVSQGEWIVKISDDAVLRVHLTSGYPVSEPPTPIVEGADGILPSNFVQDELIAPWMPGEFCVCQWTEKLREAIAEAQGQGEKGSSRERFASLIGSWAQRELSKLSPGETRDFSVSLTSFHRLVLHRLCYKLGWKSQSRSVTWNEVLTERSSSASDGGYFVPPPGARGLATASDAKGSSGSPKSSGSKDQQPAKDLRQITVTRSLQPGGLKPKDVPLKEFVPLRPEGIGQSARTRSG